MSPAARIVASLAGLCIAAVSVPAWADVTVWITAPTSPLWVQTPGSNITLSASATASGGYTISKVEFFHGATLIGTDTNSPYSIVWTNVPSGFYSVTAKVTAVKKNSPNQTATSSPVNITVNAPPTVNITSPANGAQFPLLATITLSATASDSDASVAWVEFLINGAGGESETLTAYTPPYSVEWQPVPQFPKYPYSYEIHARSFDTLGGFSNESVVTISVKLNTPPTVTLTSPAPNATFTAPANITLTAQAADSDGTVASVEFYHDSTLITTLNSAPFSFNWTGVPQGTYSLTAKAIDNWDGATTSSPINVTVNAAASELHFIQVDHLNTPRLIANQSGQTVWRWDQQEPFGVNVPNENPSGIGTFEFPVRFPGQYADKETNLHYNYFRDYEPAIGRYLESDPIGLAGGANTYTYVLANPMSWSDPNGLDNPGMGPYDPPLRPLTEPSDSTRKCVTDVANSWWIVSGWNGWRKKDKRLHCVISCEMVRKCGGESVAWAAGWSREAYQLVFQGGIMDPARRNDSILDDIANRQGRLCPPVHDCYDWCAVNYR